MNFVDLIEIKRDGGRLSARQIEWLIAEYSADRVPDYQMSSLLMAVFKEGLDGEELAAWTNAMLHSGDVLDFSHVPAPKVDKHSTGGVGDKISIPLAPIVAACGIAVPMMSGRGLGHTGGTLDKLETIPGFRTALGPTEFSRILERHGLVLAGQSETLVPADRRMYALRDVTGTVPSIPLISSSIMSKKLAEGLDGLVLDVKVGRGAFKRELHEARTLAETMVGIGRAHGLPATALITDMNQPLGREVGNASEMRESVEVLRGGGPADVVEIVYRLGAEMLTLAGIAGDQEEARHRMKNAVDSGAAFTKLVEVAEAQGGDSDALEDPTTLAGAAADVEVLAEADGYVTRVDALDIGIAALRLGAGRATKDDEIDPGAGITVEVKIGNEVAKGDLLATLHHNQPTALDEAVKLAGAAFTIGPDEPAAQPLVYEEIR